MGAFLSVKFGMNKQIRNLKFNRLNDSKICL